MSPGRCAFPVAINSGYCVFYGRDLLLGERKLSGSAQLLRFSSDKASLQVGLA